ncbi:DUF1450 domain-containing protein [uncultured Clostridium sp.]|uniref:DUF1450 domain-containing protein n=1 Tax=uncultured Clostridium sp. TaxID=59620 RepID=UPI003216EFAB
MGKKISTCKCNEGQEELVKELKKILGDDHKITENMCIGACNSCSHKYIARVDGVLVEKENLEEVLNSIKDEVHRI